MNDEPDVSPAGVAVLLVLVFAMLAGVAGWGVGELTATDEFDPGFSWLVFVIVASAGCVVAAVAAGSAAIVRELARRA